MFVPVVCDYYCGMQVLVPLDLTMTGTTAEAVAAGLADYYMDAATVKVHALNEPLPENGLYSNAMGWATDRMELYLTVNAAGDLDAGVPVRQSGQGLFRRSGPVHEPDAGPAGDRRTGIKNSLRLLTAFASTSLKEGGFCS